MSFVNSTQLLSSKIKRSFFVLKMVFLFCFFSAIANIYFQTSTKETNLISDLFSAFTEINHYDGPFKALHFLFSQTRVKDYFLSVWFDRSIQSFYFSIPISLLAIFTFSFLKKNRNLEHVRGTKISKRPPFFYAKENYSLAGVAYPKNAHKQHTIITGAPGSGKSQLLGHLLKQIRESGDIAIVYDKADLLSNFYSENDKIYNPLDARSVKIDPLSHVTDYLQAKQLAAAIVKKNASVSSGGEFFIDAARSVLTEIFVLAVKQKLSLKESIQRYKKLSLEDLKQILSTTSANKYANMENFADVLSTIENNISALDYLHDESNFSLENYLNNDDESDGWLWLTATDNKKSINSPIITLIFELVAEILLSGNKRQRTIWIIADEFASLNRLEAMQRVMQEGRKYGAAVVLGFQDIAQVQAVYGENGAQVMIGLASTFAVLRASGKTAEFMSSTLGNAEVIEQNFSESSSLSTDKNNNSVSRSERNDKSNVVLSGEISSLKNLTCYIKTVGLPVIGPRKIKFKKFDDSAAEQFVLDKNSLRTIITSSSIATMAAATVEVANSPEPTPSPVAPAADDESFWS